MRIILSTLLIAAGAVLATRGLTQYRPGEDSAVGAVKRRLGLAGLLGGSTILLSGIGFLALELVPDDQSPLPVQIFGLAGLAIAVVVLASIIPLAKRLDKESETPGRNE